MLDTQLLRHDCERVALLCRKRGTHFDTQAYKALEEKRRSLQQRVQTLQEERNEGAQTIARKINQQQDVRSLKEKMHQVQVNLKKAKSSLDDILAELQKIHLGLPNLLDESVPAGADDSDNQVLLKWGTKPSFDFTPKEHYQLFPQLLDMELAAQMSGSRFTLLRGDIALLHRALAQMMLDVHTREHHYDEVYVPLIVKKDALIHSGQLPKFAEDIFHIREKDAGLIPTAEVPLVNLVANSILDEEQLPMKVTAYSSCFRSEAGSYGERCQRNAPPSSIRQGGTRPYYETIRIMECLRGNVFRSATDFTNLRASLSRCYAMRRRYRICRRENIRYRSMVAGTRTIS